MSFVEEFWQEVVGLSSKLSFRMENWLNFVFP
jgi:hypothetical protein